ncbi:hypothetical protein [Muribaculum intestinale]|uniref:hypothetical protein n=1 Tax=Muribaculum intestinale TaxID=1796646 RepID=UPI0025AA2995|nr:hypothetical protein [Muribaculum intestinale]
MAISVNKSSIGQRFGEFLTSRTFIGFIVSVVILAAISLAFFWPDALQGGELRQHDTLQGVAISHEVETWRAETGDTPRWTNALFSGMPTFQISPDYAAAKVISAVRTAYGLWLPSPVNLLFIMMMGFFILLLAMRVRWYFALIGAIAYGMSSYFIIIIGAGHIWKFYTLAYIPPTIAGMVFAYRGRYLAGGALAALFAMFQIAGNHVQMSYYFMIVVVGFVIAYGVMLFRSHNMRRWVKATCVLAVSAVLAVLANCPNLYHTYEYSKESMRGRHSELTSADGAKGGGLDKDYITAWSYGKSETFSLLIPNVKGGATIKPEAGSNKFLSLYDVPEAGKLTASGQLPGEIAPYLGQLPQYFGDQPMTNGPVYVGALLVALFLLGCVIVKGPIKWMLLACTLISVALAWGHNMMWLTDIMIDHFPMYNKFRTVASILVVAEFTIPLLAILALKEIAANRDEWKARYQKPFFITFGICAVLCLAGMFAPELFGSFLSEQEAAAYGGYLMEAPYATLFAAVQKIRMSMISADSLRSLAFIAAGAVALWLYGNRKINVRVFAALLVVIVTVDMFNVNKRYLDSASFVPRQLAQGTPFPLTGADRKILADTAMNYRVMDIPRFNEAAPSYHHKTIGGYHAAKLTRYQDMIERHLGKFLSGQPSEADMNVLNMLNAKYVVVGENEVVENPGALGNAWLVDRIVYVDNADAEMAALDSLNPAVTAVSDSHFRDVLGTFVPAKVAGDTIYETSYAPDCLTYRVKSANGGLAVFSEVYFPWGWEVTVDGADVPLGRVDYLLRAVRVPAGTHDIVMTYSPESVRTTGVVSMASVIVIYIAALAALLFAIFTLPARGKDKEEV